MWLLVLVLPAILLSPAPAAAQLDDLLKGLGGVFGQQGSLSEARAAAGLKEALQIGSENAVALAGRRDGYFQNPSIKILMPDRLRKVEQGLRAVGYGPQVDEFILSMNRAAERAAPGAKEIFWGAIREMSFDDVRKILSGGDTAATDYFKTKTSQQILAAFRPAVEQATNEVGVTRQYKQLLGQARAIPFLKLESLDIDRYVVAKALDGLFVVLGEEERKIRTDPAARVTDLLKEVFGR